MTGGDLEQVYKVEFYQFLSNWHHELEDYCAWFLYLYLLNIIQKEEMSHLCLIWHVPTYTIQGNSLKHNKG